jgi:hypothetical protein
MIKFGEEYFKKPFYFFLKDKGDNVGLYYSISNTISEAKKTDEVIDIPKKDLSKLKGFIDSVLNMDETPSTEFVSKKLKSFKSDNTSEFKESRRLTQIILKCVKKYLKDKNLDDFKLDKDDTKFIKELPKDILNLIPKIVSKVIKNQTLVQNFTNELVKNLNIKLKIKSNKEKKGGEIEELVDFDGSFLGSSIPILQQNMHPSKDTDQYVRMSHVSQFPFLRVYYGESEEKDGDVIPEVDFSDTFGYEETEELNFKDSIEKLKDMGVDNPKERTKKFGKLKGQKRKKRGPKKGWLKQRLVELGDEKMEKMIDEILVSKNKRNSDVVKKEKEDSDESVIEKILLRNIDAIKRIADKEDVNINKLIKRLKIGE